MIVKTEYKPNFNFIKSSRKFSKEFWMRTGNIDGDFVISEGVRHFGRGIKILGSSTSTMIPARKMDPF